LSADRLAAVGQRYGWRDASIRRIAYTTNGKPRAVLDPNVEVRIDGGALREEASLLQSVP
jgi:hypothetical protein